MLCVCFFFFIKIVIVNIINICIYILFCEKSSKIYILRKIIKKIGIII